MLYIKIISKHYPCHPDHIIRFYGLHFNYELTNLQKINSLDTLKLINIYFKTRNLSYNLKTSFDIDSYNDYHSLDIRDMRYYLQDLELILF